MTQPPRPIASSRRALVAAAPLLAATCLRPLSGLAQPPPWPDRRVRMLAPAAPGSSLDLVARAVAQALAARWGQPVIVEGRPGADGIPAMEAVLAAPPGDALLLANHGVVTVTPILHPRLAFDPMTTFPPILDITADQFGVAVANDLPVRDLAALVAHAGANPGALNFTSPPGPPYLAMRAFMRDAGVQATFVGYRGVGAATAGEMLAGRLHAMMTPLAPIVGLAREGKLRVIAVTGAVRAPVLPDVPTSAEQGFPAFRQEGIHGLFGWPGMQDRQRARIAADLGAVLADGALAERLRAAGLLLRPGATTQGFAATLVEQRARWASLAQEFGAAPPS